MYNLLSLLWILVSFIILLGSIVIFGWFIDSDIITQLHPNFAAMQFNTALCFIISGSTLALILIKKEKTAFFLSMSLFTISGITLIQYIFNINLGIDLLFFNQKETIIHSEFAGRMSPTTAFCFIISSIALTLKSLNIKLRILTTLVSYIGITTLSIGSLSLLSYFSNLNLLENWHNYIQVAAHTGLGFVLLGLSIYLKQEIRAKEKKEIIDQLLEVFTLMVFALIFELYLDQRSGVLFAFLGLLILTTQKRLKNTQKISKIRNAQLEEAQKIAKIGNWSFDIKTGKIKWSKELFNFFHEDQNSGVPNFEKHLLTIHPDDRENFKYHIEKCMKYGIPYKIKYRSLFPEKQLWLEAIGQANIDQNGNVTDLFGTCQDITERVLIEEENQMIIEFLNIGIWKYNPVTQDLYWDKSMYNLYKISESNFSGHYDAWEKSLTQESKNEAVNELELALSGKKEFNTTFSILSNSDKKFTSVAEEK